MKLSFTVAGDDFSLAGQASKELKMALTRLGIDSSIIKRTAIAVYEGEMNMVIHAKGGQITTEISPQKVIIILEDSGPGIEDINLAMTEGYSTAPEWIRELGFGAGMGLPNIKRNVDDFNLESILGKGTKLTLGINIISASAM